VTPNQADLLAARSLTALGQALLENKIDFLDYLMVLRRVLDSPEKDPAFYQ